MDPTSVKQNQKYFYVQQKERQW